MAEQQQVAMKLSPSPIVVMSRSQLLLCSKEQQKRFAEYEKLGLVEIIDNDASRSALTSTMPSLNDVKRTFVDSFVKEGRAVIVPDTQQGVM